MSLIHGHYKGDRPSPTWVSWNHMKDRCSNKAHVKYHLYGGRGIKVCEKWLTFLGFLEDMGKRPTGRSLDRKDNDKGYSKENCRWSSIGQQNNNRRSYVGRQKVLNNSKGDK